MVPQTDGKAVVSFVLGVLSVCTLGLTGFPAMVVGALARRDVDRSRGALDGSGLAAAGIVSGFFGVGLGLVVVLWIAGGAIASMSHAPVAGAETPAATVPVAAGTRTYGSLEVVDLEDGMPLDAQLAVISARATREGRTVVLQTSFRSSAACAAVASALPDKRMQRALSQVTLVRADVEQFETELRALRVETRSAPWFYKLDASGRPVDAVGADAWGENVPENMAPVLGKFVRARPLMRAR